MVDLDVKHQLKIILFTDVFIIFLFLFFKLSLLSIVYHSHYHHLNEALRSSKRKILSVEI